MLKSLSSAIRGGLIAFAAIAVSSLYGCSQHETQDVRPVSPASKTLTTNQKDTTGTAAWKSFVSGVEAGRIIDPKKQYVSKKTWVPNDGQNARPTRPKGDDTKRKLISLLLGSISVNNFIQPSDPGGDDGGGTVPNTTHFSSTEIVQPYDVPPALTGPKGSGGAQRPMSFYTTENPNGYLYDLKIVKGSSANQSPFNESPYYHNIPIDLNEGAGGEYIYVSFTRDPSAVQYQDHSSGCGYNGSGGNEMPTDASGNRVDRPITYLDTEVRCCNSASNCHGVYTPMYAVQSPAINSNHLKFPDLNDGAGGSYIYAWQTRVPTSANRPIEVGVLTGNNVNITPPSGWFRVGSDLNNGAGGSYIFFCFKYR